MDWIALIPLIVQSIGTIKAIIDVASDNEGIVTNIRQSVPGLASLLENVGGTLFPKVKAQLRIAAGAMAAFDPNITKWVQGSLNALLADETGYVPLVVDGLYGPKTRAAVEQLQAKLGLTVDGWAGNLTQTAIGAALSKQPVLK